MERYRFLAIFVLASCLLLQGSEISAQQDKYRIWLPHVVSELGPLDTLVLQSSDLPSNYTRSSRWLSNEDAARMSSNYPATIAEFKAQKREQAFLANFTSQAFANDGALSVRNEVARYHDYMGAERALRFSRNQLLEQGANQIVQNSLGSASFAMRRELIRELDKAELVQFSFGIQHRRYVSFVYVIGYRHALEEEEALEIAQLAARRLGAIR
jgi:hypothetical protein